MSSQTQAERDRVAQRLGLNDWRVGVHRYPNSPRLWAHGLWYVTVQPSFHEPWIVAGTTFSEWRENAPLLGKVFFGQREEFGVIDLSDSDIEKTFNAIPLFSQSTHLLLDGIGYAVEIKSNVIKGEFRFFNPTVFEFVTLEAILLSTCKQIAIRKESQGLNAIIDLWQRYTASR